MFLLKLFFIVLLILLLLLLFILFIPFDYKAKAVSLDEKHLNYKVIWMFGLLSFNGMYVVGKGNTINLSLLGIKKRLNNSEKIKKEKPSKSKKKSSINFNTEGVKYILNNVKKLIKYFLPNKIIGYGRLGFSDPYYTGITCAAIETIRPFYLQNLKIDYVFDDEVYEGNVYIEGRIFVIYIVYIAIRLFLNKSARELIIN